jgi:DNA-binding NarL/FixJ family response regulator
MTSPRIIIADDHPLFRNGLEQALTKLIPDALIIHTEKGSDIPGLLTKHPSHLLFLDIQMKGIDGLDMIRTVRANHPMLKIIAVILMEDHLSVLEIFEAGANGFLPRNSENCKLQKVIEIVFRDKAKDTAPPLKGNKTTSSASVNSIPFNNFYTLTTREVEILGLICRQFSSKEIAGHLHLAEKTVETHRNHLMWKTQSKNVVGLIMYAIEHGYFSPENRYRQLS